MSEPAAIMLTLMGLAFWWLLFRAFLRWLDVREHARIRGPEHGSIGPSSASGSERLT